MAAINTKRVLIGALVGGLAWNAWSIAINAGILATRYEDAHKAKVLLAEPRGFSAPVFMVLWVLLIFVLSFIVTWLYAAARGTRGAGPGTALQVGALVGFAAGIPVNFSVASWGTFGRHIPLYWGFDLFVGAILAALIGGWLYKD